MSSYIDGNDVKRIREELGLTQEQFAEELNMSLSGYLKLERGLVNLSIDKVFTIKSKYGLSADYILFGDTSELDEKWTAAFRLPQVEKVNFFLRMYAYLSGIYGEESIIKKCSELAQDIDKKSANRQNGEI